MMPGKMHRLTDTDSHDSLFHGVDHIPIKCALEARQNKVEAYESG